jgi:uncharacterized paraquat-inducible protein A
MVCPKCSQEPLSFGAFVRKSQVGTLTCQRCGANLKLDRKSILGLGSICVLAGCIIWFVGALLLFSAYVPVRGLALAGSSLLFLAPAILAIKAWTWRIYRYAVKGAPPAAAGKIAH